MSHASSRPALPQVQLDLLRDRLDSIKGALGAARIGVSRRPRPADHGVAPFELLAELPGGKGERLPLAAYARLMTEPGRLEVCASEDTAGGPLDLRSF